MNKNTPPSPMQSRRKCFLRWVCILVIAIWVRPERAAANTAADGTGAGPNVTVTDNGDDTVTMANGIASIVIVKKSGRLNSATYTYNNDGTSDICETLSGKGQYYYGGFSLGMASLSIP
jgi:hypothetical protein